MRLSGRDAKSRHEGDADYSAADDLRDYDDGECFMCGGSGELDECECSEFEDTCCCLHPVPRACPECIERERDAKRRATLQTPVK